MTRKRGRVGPGGFRGTQGRKSLFPHKTHTLTLRLTDTAMRTIHATAARLTATKPPIASAETVEQVTIGDAVEYLIRRGAGVPLED
jgi:hypothetical protein